MLPEESERLEAPSLCMSVDRQIFCLKSLIFFMGLLEELQSEIERRALPGGGWASESGRSTAGIETTCYALMTLRDDRGPARQKAIDLFVRTRNQDGSWPAFEGDDPEGCWTTALAVMALRFAQPSVVPFDQAFRWLVNIRGREGDWFWNWKFRTVDRGVRFNPSKYGWPWFPGTVSWVVPTAFSLITLQQAFSCCRAEHVANRVRLGTEMLLDRACPGDGWNAGNGMVFGAALNAHIDTTAIALLALVIDNAEPAVHQALNWLRVTSAECSSPYSLAWSALAFLMHKDRAAKLCIARLQEAMSSDLSIFNTETLSLAAIAINPTGSTTNPFKVI